MTNNSDIFFAAWRQEHTCQAVKNLHSAASRYCLTNHEYWKSLMNTLLLWIIETWWQKTVKQAPKMHKAEFWSFIHTVLWFTSQTGIKSYCKQVQKLAFRRTNFPFIRIALPLCILKGRNIYFGENFNIALFSIYSTFFFEIAKSKWYFTNGRASNHSLFTGRKDKTYMWMYNGTKS